MLFKRDNCRRCYILLTPHVFTGLTVTTSDLSCSWSTWSRRIEIFPPRAWGSACGVSRGLGFSFRVSCDYLSARYHLRKAERSESPLFSGAWLNHSDPRASSCQRTTPCWAPAGKRLDPDQIKSTNLRNARDAKC